MKASFVTRLCLLLLLHQAAPAGALMVERVGAAHARIAPTSATLPARGRPFTLGGCTVTRLTDVADLAGQLNPDYPYAGEPGRGQHNGYSKYSCANLTGEYFIAFGVQPWVNGLYRRDGAFERKLFHRTRDGRALGMGETWDIRWDLSGESGTQNSIYYAFDDAIWRQDARTAAQELIARFPGWGVRHEGHMDQSTDARWRAVSLLSADQKRYKLVLLNLRTGKAIDRPLPGGELSDVSPTGRWLQSGRRFYSIPDLDAGTTRSVELPCRNFGHDGWAWDAAGRELYTFQDNTTDWMSAWNPATGERIDILNMNEMGYGLNQHMSRMARPVLKGWMLMSTYCADDGGWPYNQLFMLEIKPAAEHPRIVRLAPTQNHWMGGEKSRSYFAETFASMAPDGRAIYWANNWLGTSNLEVYRLDLPAGWMTLDAPAPTDDKAK